MCIRNVNTPFKAKEKELVNLVTKLVFEPQIRDDVCRMSAFGESQHRDFVEKRMVDKSINLWNRVPNVQLKLCKSAKKTILVKTRVGNIEMKDDRNLFSHCLLICWSRPLMDLKQILGMYALTAIPRALFYVDGSMVYSAGKSN